MALRTQCQASELALDPDFPDTFSVRMMCSHLRVSPSGFYEWRTRSPSARARENQRLLERISALHAASDGVLGRRRICEDLREEGEHCSINRIGRLMRKAGLQGIPQRRRWRRKASGERPALIRNHLDRDFRADDPNSKWATDITYVRTPSAGATCVSSSTCIYAWSSAGR